MKTIVLTGGNKELNVSALKEVNDVSGIMTELVIPGLKAFGFSHDTIMNDILKIMDEEIHAICDECDEPAKHLLCDKHLANKVREPIPSLTPLLVGDIIPKAFPQNPNPFPVDLPPLIGDGINSVPITFNNKDITEDEEKDESVWYNYDEDDEPYCYECGETGGVDEQGELCESCQEIEDDWEPPASNIWSTGTQPVVPVDTWSTALADSPTKEPEQAVIVEPQRSITWCNQCRQSTRIQDVDSNGICLKCLAEDTKPLKSFKETFKEFTEWDCPNCQWHNDTSECEVCGFTLGDDVTVEQINVPPAVPVFPEWECPNCRHPDNTDKECEVCGEPIPYMGKLDAEDKPLVDTPDFPRMSERWICQCGRSRPLYIDYCQRCDSKRGDENNPDAPLPEPVGLWHTKKLEAEQDKVKRCLACGTIMVEKDDRFECPKCSYRHECNCRSCRNVRKRAEDKPKSEKKVAYLLSDEQKSMNGIKCVMELKKVQDLHDEQKWHPSMTRGREYYSCDNIKKLHPNIDCSGPCGECPVGKHSMDHANQHGLYYCSQCDNFINIPFPVGNCPECGIHAEDGKSNGRREFCNDHWDMNKEHNGYKAGADEN